MTAVAKPKPLPCKCRRYGFPHRRTWQCVADELDREARRDEANERQAEYDRIHGTYGDNR